jgi:hypothetical protein
MEGPQWSRVVRGLEYGSGKSARRERVMGGTVPIFASAIAQQGPAKMGLSLLMQVDRLMQGRATPWRQNPPIRAVGKT